MYPAQDIWDLDVELHMKIEKLTKRKGQIFLNALNDF